MGNYIRQFPIFISGLLLLTSLYTGNVFAMEKAAGGSAKLAAIRLEPIMDNRIEILQGYLKSFNSPLTPSAKTFVKTADMYNLDYRLVAAISGVESTFGRQCPTNSYNCWGWGIYGDNMIYFKSYDDAIETISRGLRERYIDTWKASDVYEIGRFYAASPTWATRVDYFMRKIAAYEVNNPDVALSISL